MFKVNLGEHSLKDCSMPFWFPVLKMSFRTDCGKFDIVHLDKLGELFAIKFRTSVYNKLWWRSCPLEPLIMLFMASSEARDGAMQAVWKLVDQSTMWYTWNGCPWEFVQIDLSFGHLLLSILLSPGDHDSLDISNLEDFQQIFPKWSLWLIPSLLVYHFWVLQVTGNTQINF